MIRKVLLDSINIIFTEMVFLQQTGIKKICFILIFSFSTIFNINAQEVVFSDYFDIKVNSTSGELVIGQLHLKRNKDVLTIPVPPNYQFEIVSDPSNIFQLTNKREDIGKMRGLLISEFSVKSGKSTSISPTDYTIKIALKDGSSVLIQKDIVIHNVEKTMLEEISEHYIPETISETRLYGRKTLSDGEIANFIIEINDNNGQLKSINNLFDIEPEDNNNLGDDLEELVAYLGAFGYAYADDKSGYYHSYELKRAIYKSAKAYMDRVPVFGDDITGNIGDLIGDGFQGLYQVKRVLTHGYVTHQWIPVDAIAAPLAQVFPEMIKDIQEGNSEAIALKESYTRFYQMFFSVEFNLRVMDDGTKPWKDISNENYTDGAWSDANISHRMRSLMVMGLLWGDYNRPITYVPYWYDDYNDGTQFEGLSFAKNWSPRGIIQDIRHWTNTFSVPSKVYNQAGFHPDGTITHHHAYGASDVAMYAYGFEWLTEANRAIEYFQNSPLPIENESYQFLVDRINYTYRRMIYKQQLDYVITGRSHYADLKYFATNVLKKGIVDVIAGKSSSTVINNENEILELNNAIQNNTHTHTETIPFWNVEYLIHRKEDASSNYFYSIKQKSVRVSGAEDFSSIRKSWHAASGVFQLKIDGDEYSQSVLQNYNWHCLPGVTEELRDDAMSHGSASLAGSGLNEFSGVLSDGKYGVSAFNYFPTSGDVHTKLVEYSSAKAMKSYHLFDGIGIAYGSNISRIKPGQGKEIVTTIDQSLQTDRIFYSINGEGERRLVPGYDKDLSFDLTGPTWVHHDNEGYIIIPRAGQKLILKSGSEVQRTDTELSGDLVNQSNYILAVTHGTTPVLNEADGYHYAMLANVSRGEMPDKMNDYISRFHVKHNQDLNHTVYDKTNEISQVAFFSASKAFLDEANTEWIEADVPCIVMMQDEVDYVKLTIVDALQSLSTKQITLTVPFLLEEKSYDYVLGGIEPIAGETVVVSRNNDTESLITIYLPDSSDGLKYNYKEQMYAGALITVNLKKHDGLGSLHSDIEKLAGLKIFPYPYAKDTKVVLEGKMISEIKVITLKGEVIYSQSYSLGADEVFLSNTFNNKAHGIYLIEIKSTEGEVYRKLLSVI